MSYDTKVNGFTTWANVRLSEYDCLVNNIFFEMFEGTNLKLLLENLTGKALKKLKNMDGLNQLQIFHQVEYFVEEVKNHGIFVRDEQVDCPSIAERNPTHVLDMLWKLVAHDIWFTWERYVQLQHAEDSVVCCVPFKWTPRVPSTVKKYLLPGSTSDLRANLEIVSSKPLSSIKKPELPAADTVDFEPYPGSEKAKAYNKNIPEGDWLNYPSPQTCILDQVNGFLKMTSLDEKLQVKHFGDFRNSHVMCSLVNAFLPGSFTIEIILHDRWATRLALTTLEALLYISTRFTVDDLHEANPQAVCGYLCSICMAGYKYRQSQAVVNYMKKLNIQISLLASRIEAFSSENMDLKEAEEKMDLEKQRQVLENDLLRLKNNYDVEFCAEWVMHAWSVQENLKNIIIQKKMDRFEVVYVPRSITLSDFCISMGINLVLTRGAGFYQTDTKETLMANRKIVLLKKETGEFFDDFSGIKSNVRKLLNLSPKEIVELNSNTYKDFQLFFETKSKNKVLKANSLFLYQVFPGNNVPWHQQLIKAVKASNYAAVQNMISFFKDTFPDAINTGEPSTGNTALHCSSQIGCIEIVLLLLEQGAWLNVKNVCDRTPFFLAVMGQHLKVCKLLIEWGCDMHVKDIRKQTALDVIHNEEIKNSIIGHHAFCSSLVESVLQGKMNIAQTIVETYKGENKALESLRSRCIDGTTLLHSAVYFGEMDLIKALLDLKVDTDLLDYKGASPLHRSRDKKAAELLLSYGADIDWMDTDGNNPLHILAYGEPGQKDQLDCLQFLLSCKATMTWNRKGMLPIHCAAMQGRIAVIQLLLEYDEQARENIEKSFYKKQIPSPLYLAAVNGHLECIKWLASKSFNFNPGEAADLMFSILLDEIKVEDKIQILAFLAKYGEQLNSRNKNGISILHLAALRNETYELLAMLLNSGVDVEITDSKQCTPLFYAIFACNFHGTSLLIHHGANVHHKDERGLIAFDYIFDFNEWIQSGLFSDNILELLEECDTKQSCNLVRHVTNKIEKKEDNHEWSIVNSYPEWSVFKSKSFFINWNSDDKHMTWKQD